jgi:hypothetical protein
MYRATLQGDVELMPEQAAEFNSYRQAAAAAEQAAALEAHLRTAITNSYKARLRGQAATLGKKGDPLGAAKLLIKASEV